MYNSTHSSISVSAALEFDASKVSCAVGLNFFSTARVLIAEDLNSL